MRGVLTILRHVEKTQTAPAETRFEFIDFIKVFGLNILLFAIFASLFSFIPGVADTFDAIHPSLTFVVQYALQFAILFFPLWFFVIGKYGADLSDFGFHKVKISKVIGWTILAYISYFVIATLLALIFQMYGVEVPGYEAQESYLPVFGSDMIGLVVAYLFISFIAPVLEEVFFRGFVYRVFTKTWPMWLGSLLTASLFALIHFQPESFFPLMFLGLILNFLYQKTNSIWTPIVFHAFNNTLAFSVDIYLTNHPELLEELEQSVAFLYKVLA
jgi:membrane protease YdiL (CAAX protease family)